MAPVPVPDPPQIYYSGGASCAPGYPYDPFTGACGVHGPDQSWKYILATLGVLSIWYPAIWYFHEQGQQVIQQAFDGRRPKQVSCVKTSVRRLYNLLRSFFLSGVGFLVYAFNKFTSIFRFERIRSGYTPTSSEYAGVEMAVLDARRALNDEYGPVDMPRSTSFHKYPSPLRNQVWPPVPQQQYHLFPQPQPMPQPHPTHPLQPPPARVREARSYDPDAIEFLAPGVILPYPDDQVTA
jgi:hypothetical protein